MIGQLIRSATMIGQLPSFPINNESLRLTWIEAEVVLTFFKQDKREKTLNLHNAIAFKFWKRFKLF